MARLLVLVESLDGTGWFEGDSDDLGPLSAPSANSGVSTFVLLSLWAPGLFCGTFALLFLVVLPVPAVSCSFQTLWMRLRSCLAL